MNKKLRALILFLALWVILTSSYNITASASVNASAYLTSISGEVSVIRAGGINSIPAFSNMRLSQGDRIITGDAGSVTIKVIQPESERTLGSDSNATISTLKQNASENKFSIKLWSGSMWSTVSTVTGADKDIVETPGARLNVRGTNFHVAVQPDGTLSLFVASGLVAANFSNTPGSDSPILVAPTQQFSVNPTALPKHLQDALSVVDVANLVRQMDPSVLKAIIVSAPVINAENNELELQLQKLLNKNIQPVVQRDGIQSDISIKNQETLDAYLKNIDGLMSNLAFESVQQNKIALNEMNQLLTNINQEIRDPGKKIQVQNIEPLDPLAGIDPAAAQDKKQEQSRLEAFRKDTEQKQLLLQSALKVQLGESLQQLLDSKRLLDLDNKSILDKLQSEAEKMYTAHLSPNELADFQKSKQQLATNNTAITIATVPVVTIPDNPASSPTTPEITLTQTKTADGFNLSIHLKRFTGSNAIYGTEFHFVSNNYIEVIGSDNRFLNNSFFAPANSVDIVKTILGTTENTVLTKKEIIYAATQFGTISNTAIPDGVFATIPFSVNGNGTLKLFYAKLVDKTGKTILELTDTNPALPPALPFSK